MPNYNQTLQTNNSSLEEIITQLNNMPNAGGTDTSDATATANDILSGKTAYVDGEKITGNIATKTSSNLTASGSVVTVPAGYYSTQATKSIASATQATPTISLNSSTGLITATATQTAGYVAAGTKSATSQLAFKAATTITPGTVNKTAVSANTYVGGAITVKGDANLVPSNIVSGKSIFGVVGTATAGDSDPFETTSPFTYTVNSINGATYGFALNSNGYYESLNKGQNNTYAICRINLVVKTTCDITFDVINYAESSFDYALFSNLDATLNLNNSADTTNVKKSFKGLQSANIVNVVYDNVSVGPHTIDIKFIKDGSQHKDNDSVQFKIQEQQGGLPQETIEKIIAADSDLIPENIKAGVDIFGVVGTMATGDSSNYEDAILQNSLTGSYINNTVTNIKSYAFYGATIGAIECPKCSTIGLSAFAYARTLTSASFASCTSIDTGAFMSCSSLKTISFPVCTIVGDSAFISCSALTAVSLPQCRIIGKSAFYKCSKLTTAVLPAVSTICSYAFAQCSSLTTVTIGSSTYSYLMTTNISNYAFASCTKLNTIIINYKVNVIPLSGNSIFYNTGITSKSGQIYVPSRLVSDYQRAVYWSTYSAIIQALP